MNGNVHDLAALLWEKDTGLHLIGGWVGPRDCMEGLENSICLPVGFTIPDIQALSVVIIPTEPCQLLQFKH
jgi:hypothetical protein